jgi:hypothetical protein
LAHATEQDRQDVLKQRKEWFDGQLDPNPERLVFIDKTWASTNMARELILCVLTYNLMILRSRPERSQQSIPGFE